MILENEVMELFDLCMQVTAKTSAFAEITMASHTKGCYIHIRDAGYEPKAKMDARYTIFFDSKLHEKSSREVCGVAKEHLKRLLKENDS